MRLINFHTEHPASQDVFPGGSHDKVATAIHGHLQSDKPSKVVGLDGEFGSGKSSILHMLEVKLTAAAPNARVWFFDCEQNYQGSTKSNFIELFTDEVLQEVPHVSKAAAAVKASRDRGLGRLFEYTKKTNSRISVWALGLIASLFFAATSFREIFALSRSVRTMAAANTPEVTWLPSFLQGTSPWLIGIHCLSLLSPILILIGAKIWNWNTKVGDEDWSLLSLFKGSSDDRIEEKIEVGKEVTPLDLKRTLLEQLEVVNDKRFVIILDNLDRLPKESLRSVWSDLEIFIEVAARASNLTVIVPFCSTKLAEYLKADGDRRYDSKDFIAKKFPVLFRSPPVITSGWKGGFRQLWNHSFPDTAENLIEQAAQLLQRHSPMANNLVTPRLQKKFINDIATTALVVGEEISLLAIAGHLLLCKYAEFSLTEILRTDGFSESYAEAVDTDQKVQIELVKETQTLLSAILGDSMETGWQIQFLQIHYLTTGDIAIAELLDTPLAEAFANKDREALGRLTSLFGFSDAMKRFIAKRPALAYLLPTISGAHQEREGDWIAPLMDLINNSQLEVFSESSTGSKEFYQAVRYCKRHGLNGLLLTAHGAQLKTNLIKTLNSSFDQEQLDAAWQLMLEYDHYLHAQSLEFDPVKLNRAEYVMHLLSDMGELRVIKPKALSLIDTGLADAQLQLASCADHPLDRVPLPTEAVVPALEWLYASLKLGGGVVEGIAATDSTALAKFVGAAGEVTNAVVGLALASSVDQIVRSTVTTLVANSSSPLVEAVAAVIHIRESDADSLAKLEDLDGVLESSIFRALASATLTTKNLFDLLNDEQVGKSIGGFLTYLIQERRIGPLQCAWVAANFSVLANAVAPFVMSAMDVAQWLTWWDVHIEKATKDIVKADADLVSIVMGADETILPQTRDALIKQLTSEERTRDEWVQIITAGARQHLTIINAIVKKGISISTMAAVIDALIHVLNSLANGSMKSPWGVKQYTMMDALLDALDAQQRAVIGIRMRTMLFSESVEPNHFAEPLAKYGHLIPDVQPSNPQEVQRIVLFLALLSQDPEGSAGLARFFDTKAEQIAAFKYSPELRSTMGEAVAKLSSVTPALHKKFAETRGFKQLLRSLTRSARDAESEENT